MTTQTKKRLEIILVLVLIVGTVFMIQRKTPFDIFLAKDHTTPTGRHRLSKKHEKK